MQDFVPNGQTQPGTGQPEPDVRHDNLSIAGTMHALPCKHGRNQQDTPRFASEDEFEAFWEQLELEAQARLADNLGTERAGTDGNQADVHEGNPTSTDTQKDANASPNSECDESTACKRLLDAIENRPLARELMRRALELCLERQPYTDVERAIESFPEYACASVSPYQVISTLIRADGLNEIELDSDGNEISPEQKDGLSEDEADDLVDSHALETTGIGRIVVEELSPQLRLGDLFSAFSDRGGIFSEVMNFCREAPRSYQEIEALLSGRDFSGIASLNPTAHAPIQPSVFIDNLEKAGGLVWRDGWELTQEGEAMLSSLAS